MGPGAEGFLVPSDRRAAWRQRPDEDVVPILRKDKAFRKPVSRMM